MEEDEFIDKDINIRDYLHEIISSFKEISKKEFVFNFDQDSNPKKISKSIEIVYGLRNFIGNANKFAKNSIFINLKSDSEFTELTIEDDGNGYPRDIISKIGEPYLKSNYSKDKSKEGLEIRQYNQNSMKETFERAGFKSISFSKSDHLTPSNKIQKFIFGVFKNSN